MALARAGWPVVIIERAAGEPPGGAGLGLDRRLLSWVTGADALDCRALAIGEREAMDLEQALAKVVELGREELHIVRKRAEEKTPARDHGHDFDEMLRAADRLDHHAHLLRRIHDGQFGQHWRHESRQDVARGS